MRTKETHNDVIIAPHGLRRITIILQGKFTFCLIFNFHIVVVSFDFNWGIIQQVIFFFGIGQMSTSGKIFTISLLI